MFDVNAILHWLSGCFITFHTPMLPHCLPLFFSDSLNVQCDKSTIILTADFLVNEMQGTFPHIGLFADPLREGYIHNITGFLLRMSVECRSCWEMPLKVYPSKTQNAPLAAPDPCPPSLPAVDTCSL